MQDQDIEAVLEKAETLIRSRNYKEICRENKGNMVDIMVEDQDKMKILFRCIPSTATVGVRYVKRFVKEIQKVGVNRGIIVCNGRFSFSAKNVAEENAVELLSKAFPSFNIFDHELVPKHEILPPSEVTELLREYRIKPYQLPWIRASDPAVKAIGARPGDILKITRKSLTSGRIVAYRYVVKD